MRLRVSISTLDGDVVSTVKRICDFFRHGLGPVLIFAFAGYWLAPGLPLWSQDAYPLILAQSEAPPQKGKFLVASRNLRDPNFVRSVVFLVSYGCYGAMGLVINRPSPYKLADVLPDAAGSDRFTEPVFIGGPVAMNRLLILGVGVAPAGAQQIIQGVHISSNLDELERLPERDQSDPRLFAGHSGWAPGQLDAEIARGDWHVLPADRESIFDKEASRVWLDLIQLAEAQLASTKMAPGFVVFAAAGAAAYWRQTQTSPADLN